MSPTLSLRSAGILLHLMPADLTQQEDRVLHFIGLNNVSFTISLSFQMYLLR